MPLIVPGLVEPKSKEEEPKDIPKDTKQDKKEDKPKEDAKTSSETKKIDGRKAPGMEGMSDEAVKKFEEAMELEYQKREGGA